MSKCEMPKSYEALWYIVIILSILALVSVGFNLYQGRWVCDEYKDELVIRCPTNFEEGGGIAIGRDIKLPDDCYLSTQRECVKEVWTRKQ